MKLQIVAHTVNHVVIYHVDKYLYIYLETWDTVRGINDVKRTHRSVRQLYCGK